MPTSVNEPKGGPLFDQEASDKQLAGELGKRGLVRTGLDVRAEPLARVESQPLALTELPNATSEVMQLIRVALDNKMDPGKLYDVLNAERARQAKSEFIAAKAKFQRECPPIPKSQANPQFEVKRDGVMRQSMFAPLEAMQTVADPHLEANGFSCDWKEPTPGPNGERYLHFVMSHVGGHSEEYPARITTPEKGGCSEPQKDGIAYEYARRQSYRNGTGIRVVGEDTDGNDPTPEAALTEDQRRTVNDLLVEAGLPEGKPRVEWLRIFEVERIADLKATMFGPVTNALNARIKGQRR